MNRRWMFRVLLVILDTLLFESLFFLTYIARFRTGMFVNPVAFTAPELLIPSFVVTTYWIMLAVWFGLYRYDPLEPRSDIARNALVVAAFGVLILFILTFDPNRPLPQSRVILGGYGVTAYLILAGDRILMSTVLRALRIRGMMTAPTLLVGSGPSARAVLDYVRSHPEIGFRVTSFIGTTQGELPQTVQRQGGFSLLRSCLTTSSYDVVLLGLEPSEQDRLGRLVRMMRQARVRSYIQAEQYPALVGEVRPTIVHGHPLVEFRSELLTPAERALKRVTDVLLAAVLFFVTLPIWILVLIAIPLESKGPVVYRQRRVGLNGRDFILYKFRSMYLGAEETGPALTQERDPRVTHIGRFLRSSRLDELPQLLNVLFGQMSMVGPRPERREFVELFVRQVPLYERRLNVKPGITGWSQVHLKYDSRADQIPIKLKYDFYYIENMSLPLDVKILFMTLFVMLRGEGL